MSLVEDRGDAKEVKIPAALMAAGILIAIVHAVFFRQVSVGSALLSLAVTLFLRIILGIAACFLTNRFAGVDYGTLGAACLKWGAIFIFPTAVALLIPIACIGFLASLLLYWGLIEWLFDLEAMDTIVTVVAIWLTQVGAFFLAAVVLAATPWVHPAH